MKVAIYALPRESLNESERVAESIAGPFEMEWEWGLVMPLSRVPKPDWKHHCSAEILPIPVFCRTCTRY